MSDPAEIPIHMVFPRLFTCPSVGSRTFKIEFEFNFVLMFPDGRLISKKYHLFDDALNKSFRHPYALCLGSPWFSCDKKR